MSLDLVCGGAGFIGSHMVEALLAAGREVRVLDDLSTGYARNLEGLDCEFLKADAADPGLAAQACQGVETIYHFGARPSVPWSFQEPELAYHANHRTTLSLLQAGADAGVRRLVFSSSSAIYGDSPELPKRESMEPAPKSPYAEHKLAGEHALAAAAAERKLEAVSLRYFNVFGPRQDPTSPYSGVISLFARWLHEGQAPTFYGDGLQTRDFVYVKDVVEANRLAGQACLPEGQAPVFNVACGHSLSILELWETMCRVAGKAPGPAEFLPAREGDVRHSSADLSAIREALAFEPSVPLEEGLRRTLESLG